MANQRPAIVRAILWIAVVGITQVGSATLAVAQLATIDLDQLSKISYSLGAMKEQEQKLFDLQHSPCNMGNHELAVLTRCELHQLIDGSAGATAPISVQDIMLRSGVARIRQNRGCFFCASLWSKASCFQAGSSLPIVAEAGKIIRDGTR
jgi:hypothetical protein